MLREARGAATAAHEARLEAAAKEIHQALAASGLRPQGALITMAQGEARLRAVQTSVTQLEEDVKAPREPLRVLGGCGGGGGDGEAAGGAVNAAGGAGAEALGRPGDAPEERQGCAGRQAGAASASGAHSDVSDERDHIRILQIANNLKNYNNFLYNFYISSVI